MDTAHSSVSKQRHIAAGPRFASNLDPLSSSSTSSLSSSSSSMLITITLVVAGARMPLELSDSTRDEDELDDDDSQDARDDGNARAADAADGDGVREDAIGRARVCVEDVRLLVAACTGIETWNQRAFPFFILVSRTDKFMSFDFSFTRAIVSLTNMQASCSAVACCRLMNTGERI